MSDQYFSKYPDLTASITSLFEFQSAAISNLLDGKNTLCIAPTGKGKSIIYQIAAQELPGITIVVSPLTALIKEQVQILKGTGTHAAALTSEMKFADQRVFLRTFSTEPPKVIFLSPERLQNSLFRAAIIRAKYPVSMIVVDEAHCVSQWGIDFRPEYGQIEKFITYLNQNQQKPVILALTATLGVLARETISKAYSIEHSSIFIENNFVRPELHLNFIEVEEENDKDETILEILNSVNSKKAIIYFYSIYKCEKITKLLSQEGYKADMYYAGIDGEDKDETYLQFLKGNLDVLCATTAFGMGMNIPDIDLIIHYNLPNSIEEYYQQVGRAARDKRLCNSAECFLLWSPKNFEYKIEEHIEPQQLTIEAVNEAFKKLGLEEMAGKIQGVEYSNYQAQNLSFFRFLFEDRNIIEFAGEVNGSPKSIVFKKNNQRWNEIISKMDFGNNFLRAAENSNLTIQELINYIFEEELSGNIKTFKALEKKLFFKSTFNEVPLELAYDIIEQSILLVEFKIEQLDALRKMIESNDPNEYILNYFR